ncbi:hypothetical protein CSB20_04355 [bacterium DOLZORAL124_64_63]|nr:MAG: hypothetical protein CSB20_04355 [bacterium DOLZORAL124_64_63]
MSPEPDLTAAALRMAAALVAGFALLFTVLWLVRRLMGTGMPGGGRRLRVLERVMLAPGHQAALLQVPGALLVVGMSREGIRVLHTSETPAIRPPDGGPSGILLADKADGDPAAPQNTGISSSFSAALASALGRSVEREHIES